jgi:medium-chain acyl-[acyl-carrier-protein] hydrolase
MSDHPFNSWITCPKKQPNAKIRLFCLPFAGGGASLYRPWAAALAPEIEVCPIQPPGRENRYSEKVITDAYEMANAIAAQMLPFIDRPYAIFGHSMGALLSFEITKVLQSQKKRPPEILFLSAHRAAHLPRKRDPLHALPDSQFIESLKQYGGFPEEILNNQEFIDFILPTMRSDMTLCDLYTFKQSETPIMTPLEMYAGEDDREAGPSEMSAWSEHTSSESNLTTFKGGHFFLRTHSQEVLEKIAFRIGQLKPVIKQG